MILVIDNYDSFTFNLAQYLGELGQDLKVFRNDAITVDEIAGLKPERIVISPGPGRPENSGIIVETIQKLAGKIPILGVCLGHQAIGAAFGAKWSAPLRSCTGRRAASITTGRRSFAGSRIPLRRPDIILWWSLPRACRVVWR